MYKIEIFGKDIFDKPYDCVWKIPDNLLTYLLSYYLNEHTIKHEDTNAEHWIDLYNELTKKYGIEIDIYVALDKCGYEWKWICEEEPLKDKFRECPADIEELTDEFMNGFYSFVADAIKLDWSQFKPTSRIVFNDFEEEVYLDKVTNKVYGILDLIYNNIGEGRDQYIGEFNGEKIVNIQSHNAENLGMGQLRPRPPKRL